MFEKISEQCIRAHIFRAYDYEGGERQREGMREGGSHPLGGKMRGGVGSDKENASDEEGPDGLRRQVKRARRVEVEAERGGGMTRQAHPHTHPHTEPPILPPSSVPQAVQRPLDWLFHAGEDKDEGGMLEREEEGVDLTDPHFVPTEEEEVGAANTPSACNLPPHQHRPAATAATATANTATAPPQGPLPPGGPPSVGREVGRWGPRPSHPSPAWMNINEGGRGGEDPEQYPRAGPPGPRAHMNKNGAMREGRGMTGGHNDAHDDGWMGARGGEMMDEEMGERRGDEGGGVKRARCGEDPDGGQEAQVVDLTTANGGRHDRPAPQDRTTDPAIVHQHQAHLPLPRHTPHDATRVKSTPGPFGDLLMTARTRIGRIESMLGVTRGGGGEQERMGWELQLSMVTRRVLQEATEAPCIPSLDHGGLGGLNSNSNLKRLPGFIVGTLDYCELLGLNLNMHLSSI